MNDGGAPVSGAADAKARALAGKYMVFRLGDEEYGLGIRDVREIIGRMDVRRVPGAHADIRGVVNLRGKVIPVVDLRLKLAMERTMDTDQTVLIVVQRAAGGEAPATAVVVDEVLEVLDIDPASVEPPPGLGGAAPTAEIVLGIGKAGSRVVFLLDAQRILLPAEHGIGVSAA